MLDLIRRLTNSPKALVYCYLSFIVSGATLFWYFEPKRTVGDSIWWAVVTTSTVGYGDVYPITTGGRIVSGLLISVMVLFVIPMITAQFASKLIVNNDAFQHEEQEEIKSQLREIRVLVESMAGGERLRAQLSEVEARVGEDPGGDAVALPQQP